MDPLMLSSARTRTPAHARLKARLHASGSALLVALLLATPLAHACSSCGCTLNADWASQGYTAGAGWRFDLRHDYFDQDELRRGNRRVDTASLALPRDEEVQRYTVNHNTAATLDWSPSRTWGLSLSLPYYVRSHGTVDEGETALSRSHSSGLGDVRITARYQGFSADLSSGVLIGLKLPTGTINDTFSSGPTAGEPVDRGLQLGTGTTDLLVGGYRFGMLGDRLGYFAQGLVQLPLDSRRHFRPGNGLNLSAGLRWLEGRITPQLQLNARIEGRERGDQADVDNSGATLIYLSPGLNVQLGNRLNAYLFVQRPLYQHVNGLQLEPDMFYSLGARYRF